MSKELILKMCEEVISVQGFIHPIINCGGILCADCPFGYINNKGVTCQTDTDENYIKIAKNYIAENGGENMEFKVGDKVRRVDGTDFSNDNSEVTIKEIIKETEKVENDKEFDWERFKKR